MAVTFNFDPLFPADLTGNFAGPQVVDMDGTQNRVLQIGAQFKVKLDWDLVGSGVSSVGGGWDIKVSLESMGEGPEGPIISDTKLYTDILTPPSTPTHLYWHTEYTIADIRTPMPGIVPGVYKLVVLLLHKDSWNHPDAMAAYSEGPTLAFFTP
jgi:hypothetical protein